MEFKGVIMGVKNTPDYAIFVPSYSSEQTRDSNYDMFRMSGDQMLECSWKRVSGRVKATGGSSRSLQEIEQGLVEGRYLVPEDSKIGEVVSHLHPDSVKEFRSRGVKSFRSNRQRY